MTDMPTVAVLGLGRMGAAIAATVAAAGCPVRAWSRTPRPVLREVDLVHSPATAVHEAAVVLMSLFDGPACEDVMAQYESVLTPDSIVVNASTIAPKEAAKLAERLRNAGTRYVHAPVLGSVPAVHGRSLSVLAGGDPGDIDDVRETLSLVAKEIRYVGTPAQAAALKLVANSSLAGAFLALRDVLSTSAALGLDLEAALDVLATGFLGSIITGKRDRLDRSRPLQPADFSVGTLQKDLRLLNDASGVGTHAGGEIDRLLHSGAVSPADDVAALCLPTA